MDRQTDKLTDATDHVTDARVINARCTPPRQFRRVGGFNLPSVQLARRRKKFFDKFKRYRDSLLS